MCHRADKAGCFFVGLGVGFLLSLLFGGWFLCVVLGFGLIALGWFLISCD